MQIREQGKRIQFIRTTYMPALKRGLSKVVLSVPTDCLDERPIGIGKLSREEQHLVREYMRAKRENAHLVALQH